MSARSALPPVPPELRAPLARTERFALALALFFNTRLKWLCSFYQQTVLAGVVWACIGRRLRGIGIERLAGIPAGASLLIVANHRTFFDNFASSFVLRRHGYVRRYYYPVRANFFYQRIAGLLVNFFLAGMAMFPPVFRDKNKLAFNRWSLQALCAVLARPGSLVGYHPEGTRNKGPDPYAFLPAQPGAGKLVAAARPVVVPCFVHGMSNDLPREFWKNLRGRDPIYVVFGAPVELDDLIAAGDRPAIHKRISDRLMEHVARLAAEERALRAAPAQPSPVVQSA